MGHPHAFDGGNRDDSQIPTVDYRQPHQAAAGPPSAAWPPLQTLPAPVPGPPATGGGGVPTGRLLVRLGFVTVVLAVAVALVVLGLPVAAVVELILAAGFVGVEIVRRLS